ncbi:hypothetical protein HDU80_005768 [Chytriomyces hyalinus]|nr:hypothetical protein HDU80_005768 [Chytriomyces hyalinus]
MSTSALLFLLMATLTTAQLAQQKPLGCFSMKSKPTVALTSNAMNPALCSQSCGKSRYVLIAPLPNNRLSFWCACTSQLPSNPSRIACNDACPGSNTIPGLTCGGFDESGEGSIAWSLYPSSAATAAVAAAATTTSAKSMKVALLVPPAPAVFPGAAATVSESSRPPFEPVFVPNPKPQQPQEASFMKGGNAFTSNSNSNSNNEASSASASTSESASTTDKSKTTENPTKEEGGAPPPTEETMQQHMKKPTAVSNSAMASEPVAKQVEEIVVSPAFLAGASGSLAIFFGMFSVAYRRRRLRARSNSSSSSSSGGGSSDGAPILPQTVEKENMDLNLLPPIGAHSVSSFSRSSHTLAASTIDMNQIGSENIRFGSMRSVVVGGGGEPPSNSFTSESFGRLKTVEEISISVGQSVPTLGVLRCNFKDSEMASLHSHTATEDFEEDDSKVEASKCLSLSRSTSLMRRDNHNHHNHNHHPVPPPRRRRSRKNRWNERVKNLDNNFSRFSLASNSTSATNSPMSPSSLYIRRKRTSAKSGVSSMTSRAPSSLFMNVLAYNLVQNAKMEDEANENEIGQLQRQSE